MRKTLLAVISTAALALTLTSPPGAAHAAVASYVVSGHPITAAPGLSLVGDTCAGGGAPPTVTDLERQGGALGSSALGWQVNQAGSEAGPAATLAGDPDLLNTFQISAHAPAGTAGHAYVRLDWDADTYYVGWNALTVPAGGWWQFDLSDDVYAWTLYDAGNVTDVGTGTISSFVTGPGFTSAKLGALFGCGGEQFYVDRLVVANAANSVTYDFEAKAPPPPPPPHHVAHLEWSTNGRDVTAGERLVIRHGQSLWMLGHAHLHSASGASWYSGRGTMTRQHTRGGARPVGAKSFTPTAYAAFKQEPTQETTYTFVPETPAGLAPAVSNNVTVFVRSKVKALVLDRHLIQGQRLKVKGRVTPGKKRVKVALQRKVGRRWVTLAKSRTARRGAFALGTKVRKPGTWKVRVKVAGTLVNLGATTKPSKVRVDRYVPPPAKPSAPPPPPGKDYTTDAPVKAVTPAPVKVTGPVPKPPPRPTPTGRTEPVAEARPGDARATK